MTDTDFHTRRTQLANACAVAAGEWLVHMGADSAMVAIPNTTRYVVAGSIATIRAQLDTVEPQRRVRKGDRPDEQLYWGVEAGQPRRWTILITEGGKGVVGDYGYSFPDAKPEFERVDVVEVATPTATNTAGAVPEGWKLVPVEPTAAMLEEISLLPEFTHRALSARYAAMLAAAPSAPALAEPAPQWISVDERLPEFRHECTTSGCGVSDSLLIYGQNAFGTTGCGFGHARDDGSWACYEAEYYQLTVEKVTHWMALPKGPALRSNQEKGGADA